MLIFVLLYAFYIQLEFDVLQNEKDLIEYILAGSRNKSLLVDIN